MKEVEFEDSFEFGVKVQSMKNLLSGMRRLGDSIFELLSLPLTLL